MPVFSRCSSFSSSSKRTTSLDSPPVKLALACVFVLFLAGPGGLNTPRASHRFDKPNVFR